MFVTAVLRRAVRAKIEPWNDVYRRKPYSYEDCDDTGFFLLRPTIGGIVKCFAKRQYIFYHMGTMWGELLPLFAREVLQRERRVAEPIEDDEFQSLATFMGEENSYFL